MCAAVDDGEGMLDSECCEMRSLHIAQLAMEEKHRSTQSRTVQHKHGCVSQVAKSLVSYQEFILNLPFSRRT